MEIIARLKYSEKSDQIELSKSFEFSRLFLLVYIFQIISGKAKVGHVYPL